MRGRMRFGWRGESGIGMETDCFFEEGYAAFTTEGADWADCPYDTGTDEEYGWHWGWEKAVNDAVVE